VTSGFGNRFHPVLQYVAAHQGVDYAAAVGTPVWAVADGVVTVAGNTGAGGNTLCLRHHNGLETCYLHLSAFGSGVRVGAHVTQKQVIALSGNTGRTTGPHLHFALKRGGVFVNPLNQKFPRAEPVPAKLLVDFQDKLRPISAQLDAAPVVTRVRPLLRPAVLTLP
jgi:murein DD-endopeptidase MepM/ murein hydrolase activator NlpD